MIIFLRYNELSTFFEIPVDKDQAIATGQHDFCALDYRAFQTKFGVLLPKIILIVFHQVNFLSHFKFCFFSWALWLAWSYFVTSLWHHKFQVMWCLLDMLNVN